MAQTVAENGKGAVPANEPAVLVIDPNEEHQVLSTMALGRRGFRVTIAGTAREGLRVALSQTFAVVVIDLKLRDVPALDVLSVLRERIPDVPKVLVVSAGQEQLAVRALASGASGFLVKTARYNELLPSEVEAQLRAAQARRSLKEQKKALGESEERFQKAFRASPVAMSIVARRDGRFIEANDAFLRLVGYARDELVGRADSGIGLQLDISMVELILKEVGDKGSIRELEVPFRTKTGEPRIGLASIEAIEIEGESSLVTILRDVTEERRAERLRSALYEISESTSTAKDFPDLFRRIHSTVAGLMSAQNFYIALYDPTADLIEFPYFVDERESTPEPYQAGRGLTEFVLRSGEPLLVTPQSFAELLAAGRVDVVGAVGIDWLGVPLSIAGRTFGVLAVQSYSETTRYTEADKQVLSMISAQVALAIDRKRSAQALREAEARFRTVFEDAPMGIALSDSAGRIRETNPAFQRMVGRSADELQRLTVAAITYPEDAELTGRLFAELLAGKRNAYHYEKRYVRKDGTPFWARVTAALLKVQGSESQFVLAAIEDITEAKAALEARETDARRFEALIANISDGMSLLGPDGLVTWQSPSAQRMFGYTSGEAVGHSGLELVHPEDLANVGPGFQELLSSPGKSLVAEVRIRRKDGSWRWSEIVGTNLLQDPDLRAIVFNYRDITERNEALEQIRFQASLLSQVRNAVVATDAEFRIVYWNDYATTMYGWRLSEVRGKRLNEIMVSSEAQAAFRVAASAVRETGHWEGERIMSRKGGSRFTASVTVTALRGRDGSIVGYVGVITDVSERVRASEALEARARQQAAIAALGQKALVEPSLSGLMAAALEVLTQTLAVEFASILEISPGGRDFVLRAKIGGELPLGARVPNDSAESLEGYTLSVREPVILANAATETRFKVPLRFTERGLTSGISVVLPGQTGAYGILGAQSTSARAFSEDDVHFVTSVANVIASAAERSRIEKELAENERLASMGQLAAYVAHEINTPLTNISLLAANIARREADPEILQKLAAVGEQRRRVSTIITDLMDVPEQLSLRRAPEDIRRVVAAAVEQVAPFRKPDVSLVVEPGDRALFANIDTIQLRDVFVSLLRNALQATSRGSVTVRLSELPQFLFVSIEDTGTGIGPEALQQLFHPLYGAGKAADSPLLGLAISRSIVAAHGGKIEATSEVGKGSTFTVILPRFESH